ncbi:MAG: carboxymuconolactone decarboxylase family protein [Planctomycetes bacterium]|nr:carboxymuconolactone decarboxylase family protein [Planctomycetota bacterium]
MAWIRDHSDDPECAELLRAHADPATGAVDNILRVHALHPAGLRAHLAVYRAAMTGTGGLRRAEREMIAVVVSGLNGCRY